jgi:isopentenyl diphosphate isomerase/L-lactate dehydrogenase-like FMN-dependent dehydrogenase
LRTRATSRAAAISAQAAKASAGRLARIMAGVENMLEIFATEMRVAMTLTGVTPVARIDRTVLV